MLETIAGRGSLFEIIRTDEVRRRITAIKSELEFNSGLLNLLMSDVKHNTEIRNKDRLKRIEELAVKIRKYKSPELQVDKNSEVPKQSISEKSIPEYALQANRFRYAATELLIVNRYLEADDNFYESSENYFDTLQVLNDQMRVLETLPENTELYLIKTESEYVNCFKTFEEKLQPFL